MHTAAYKYETQQKYIDKTEIKQKLRSTIHGMGQLSSPFTIKMVLKRVAFKYTASWRTGLYTPRTLEDFSVKGVTFLY